MPGWDSNQGSGNRQQAFSGKVLDHTAIREDPILQKYCMNKKIIFEGNFLIVFLVSFLNYFSNCIFLGEISQNCQACFGYTLGLTEHFMLLMANLANTK